MPWIFGADSKGGSATTESVGKSADTCLAAIGAWIHIGIAIVVLFFPLLDDCWLQAGIPTCERRSCFDLCAPIWQVCFVLMLIVGLLVFGTTLDIRPRRARLIRGLGAVLSHFIILITFWSYGLAFAPSTLLITASALWQKRKPVTS